jgi:cytidylate kinase
MLEGRSDEIRREAAVPVQSRIDVRTLAEVCEYFRSEGIEVRTVSKLVSWSLEGLVDIIKRNGKLRKDKPSVEEAYQFLDSVGMMQNRMKNSRKLSQAMGFEQLRYEGVSPKGYNQPVYDAIHNNPNCRGEEPPKSSITNSESSQEKSLAQCIEEGNALCEAREKAKRMEEYKKSNDEMMDRIEVDENGMVIQPNWTDEQCGRCGQKFVDEVAERNERQNKIAEREAEDERKRKKEIKERNKTDKKREKLLNELKDLDKDEEKLTNKESNTEDNRMRTRNYEEILEDRIKKDKIQEDKLKALDTIPRR